VNRRFKLAVLASLLCLVAAQAIRPSMVNSSVNPARSVLNDPRMNPQVAHVLRRACLDCHSNETRWPWYSKISPVSWLISRHVTRGRAKLNFSDWNGSSTNEMDEIYDAVHKGKMPPSSYSLIHPDARLSNSEREELERWTDTSAPAATLRDDVHGAN